VIDLRLGRLPPPAPVLLDPGAAPGAVTPGGAPSAPAASPPAGTLPGTAPGTPGADRAPAPSSSAGRDDPHDYYVVQAGDTLSSIAQKQLGSAAKADELVRLNRLADADGIVAGQVLRLR